MNITLTDEQAENLGSKIVELFNLKQIKCGEQKGRYNTSFGTKTKKGISRSIVSIILDDKETVDSLKEILEKS